MQTRGYRTATWAIALFASFTVQLARADYAAQVLSLNPDQYWRLNETIGSTAVNEIGTGVAGAYGNAALGLPGPRPPAFPGFDAGNNAPGFNGVDSMVGTGSSLLSNQSSFTLLGWFYQSANQSFNRVGLFGQDNAIEFGFIAPDTLQLYTDASFSLLDIPWDGSLNNTWVFAAAVGDGTSISVYLNGSFAGSLAAFNFNYGASSAAFNIGGNVFGFDGGSYNGQIDEVAILNNRVLTAGEIRALYDAAFVPEPTGLVLLTCGGIACGVLRLRRRHSR